MRSRPLPVTVLKDGLALMLWTKLFFHRRLYTAGLPDPDLLIRIPARKGSAIFLLWSYLMGVLFYREISGLYACGV